MTDAHQLPATCLECGACCFGDGPRYLRISGDDHARLGAATERLTQFIGNRCYMRLVDSHCGALGLEREAGHFACEVYEQRPRTCRQLERGSDACLAEFERKRGRAQRALAGLPALPLP